MFVKYIWLILILTSSVFAFDGGPETLHGVKPSSDSVVLYQKKEIRELTYQLSKKDSLSSDQSLHRIAVATESLAKYDEIRFYISITCAIIISAAYITQR